MTLHLPSKPPRAALVLATLATGLKLGAVGVIGMFALCEWMVSGVMPERSMKVAKFVDATKYCIIITNKTAKPWKFGYLSQFDSEVDDKQSGKFEYSAVDARLEYYDKKVQLEPAAAPVLVPANYGALILKPKCERPKSLSWWQPFFRVCYIEDGAGQRIYLNIAKGTKDSDTPTVGLAAVSQATAMGSPGSGPKVLELYTPSLAKDRKLLSTNLLAIGSDRIEKPRRK
jgi:hypothetical protein